MGTEHQTRSPQIRGRLKPFENILNLLAADAGDHQGAFDGNPQLRPVHAKHTRAGVTAEIVFQFLRNVRNAIHKIHRCKSPRQGRAAQETVIAANIPNRFARF